MESCIERIEADIQRNDSGHTDESGFDSNLATPSDEQEIDFLPIKLMDPPSSFTGKEAHLALTENESDFLESENTPKKRKEEYLQVVADPSNRLDKRLAMVTQLSQISTADSTSSIVAFPSASELLAQSRRRSSGMYSLPNTHISVENVLDGFSRPPDPESEPQDLETIRLDDFIPSVVDPGDVSDDILSRSWLATTFDDLIDEFDAEALALSAVRILLFLPWCISVGAAIVLSPARLDSIAFSDSRMTSFVEKPPSAIHRYAYLSNYGMEHVMIFFGTVLLAILFVPPLGLVVVALLLAQISWTWGDFIANHDMALGTDERQIVYHLATTVWWSGEVEELEFVDGCGYHLRSPKPDVGPASEAD